jgi:hypothetical protein
MPDGSVAKRIAADWYELYYTYRGGGTNHEGPIVGLDLAKDKAEQVMDGCRSLLRVYIIPYTAGSFHPDHAVATVDRYQECPCCGHRYDPRSDT